MTKEIVPYTAIPEFLNRTPQELSSPGKEMEFYPRLTAMARIATGSLVKEFIIEDKEIERYQNAGTCLVAPSHRSFLDITAVAELSERSGEGQPYFMSKRENMDNKLSAWFFGHMRTFPIDRDMADRRWQTAFMKWGRFAMGNDIDRGEQNKKMVMFPEGTRKEGDTIEELEQGTLVLAKRVGVPILPIGVYTSHLGFTLKRPTLMVTVGEPFKAGMRDLDLLAAKIQEQYDRAKFIIENR